MMAYRHEDNYPEVVPNTYSDGLTSAEAYKTGGYAGAGAGEKMAGVYPYQAAAVAPAAVGTGAVAGAGAVASPGAVGPDYAPTPMTPAPPYHYPDHSGAAAAAPPLPPVDERAVGSGGGVPNGEKPASTILGLKKKTFWIAIVVLVIVIAAAVGGGVGGAAAAKNKSKNDDTEAAEAAEGTETASPTPTIPETTSSSTSTSTSTSASATSSMPPKTIDLGFQFEGWSEADFEGESTGDTVIPIGFTDFDFNVTSYKWNPKSSGCCITFCQGEKKDVGWRCTAFDRDEASAVFSRIYVGCGKDATEENSRCS